MGTKLRDYFIGGTIILRSDFWKVLLPKDKNEIIILCQKIMTIGSLLISVEKLIVIKLTKF
jgi:hypothetical protein